MINALPPINSPTYQQNKAQIGFGMIGVNYGEGLVQAGIRKMGKMPIPVKVKIRKKLGLAGKQFLQRTQEILNNSVHQGRVTLTGASLDRITYDGYRYGGFKQFMHFYVRRNDAETLFPHVVSVDVLGIREIEFRLDKAAKKLAKGIEDLFKHESRPRGGKRVRRPLFP